VEAFAETSTVLERFSFHITGAKIVDLKRKKLWVCFSKDE